MVKSVSLRSCRQAASPKLAGPLGAPRCSPEILFMSDAMPAYQLPCSCGQRHVVSTKQAGGEIRCSCGVVLAVPTLRKLRELPLATVDTKHQGSTWGPRAQWACLGGVVATVLAVVALWAWFSTPHVPTWSDLGDDFVARRKQMIEQAPPQALFMAWEQEYQNELLNFDERGMRDVALVDAFDTDAKMRASASGDSVFLIPGLEYQKRMAARTGAAAKICGGLAAIVAVLTIAIVPFLPRR